jgi:hypothetical protein
MPGCGLRASLDVMLAWPPAAAHFRTVPIPNSAGLIGTDVFATAAVFQVPPVNLFGAITANGLKGRIGNL